MWHALYAWPEGWGVHVPVGKRVVSHEGIVRRWWARNEWRASIWSTHESVHVRHGGCRAESRGKVPVLVCTGEGPKDGCVGMLMMLAFKRRTSLNDRRS